MSEYFYRITRRRPLAGERQPAAALLHTLHKSRDLLIAYIERAMEVLLQYCTEGPPARAHATKLYGDFLLSLQRYPGDDDDDDDVDGRCFFFQPKHRSLFLNIIIIHLLHSHIHCDLDHSCSILTLHDLHFFLNTRNENFPPQYIEGNFPFPHLHRWQHCYFFFKFSNLPPEGREVT